MSAPAALSDRNADPASEARCPCCGSAEIRNARPDAVGARAILACETCETVFVWPRLEQDFSQLPESAYYDDWQALDLDTLDGLFNDVTAARRRINSWSTSVAERPSILEVGCGAGHALTHFRAHGWRVAGIDPWQAVTEAGRKYYRLPIETGRIETARTIAPESQDLVMAVDVLQFAAEPRRMLEACLAALKPGGMIYLTLPNFASAASRREGWNWHYFIPISYLTYFTPDTLGRLIESVGFGKAEITTFGAEGDSFLRVVALRPVTKHLSWDELGGEVDDTELPPLDRRDLALDRLTPEQRHWRENGYVILRNFIPDELIDRYSAVRSRIGDMGGWPSPTPYLDVPEIRDLCLYGPLSNMLEHLIGEPMALHLNLTGWVSTERSWHQDDYLNPPEVNGHYIAVWTALDQIQPDAGPFEFVPGSHRWPFIRQAKVLSLLGRDDRDSSWPWASERLLTPFFQEEIARRSARVERFLGGRGDVLIWHARLLHRGSPPERPGAERRSMIAHYSAVGHRTDMTVTRRHPEGGLYFVPAEPSSDAAKPSSDAAKPMGLLRRLRDRFR
ncbi:MAG TPA: phytanoyl-CoA dioxygenase family protein [Aliidongia sp.]|nr:phytanoyl-CoA dioxygenase family protein [Aliidongia sp.]